MDNYIFFICENGYGDIGEIGKWNKKDLNGFNEYKENLKGNHICVREISWAEYQMFEQFKDRPRGVQYAYYLLGYEEPLYLGRIQSYNEYIK